MYSLTYFKNFVSIKIKEKLNKFQKKNYYKTKLSKPRINKKEN